MSITADEAEYRLVSGPPMRLRHHGEPLALADAPVVRPLPEPPFVDPVEQPHGRAPAGPAPRRLSAARRGTVAGLTAGGRGNAREPGAPLAARSCVPTTWTRTPVNPDRARELLTAELKELDDRAEFAASSAAESASGDLAANEAGTTQHPADFGTEVTNRMESEGLVRTVELQRRRVQDALDRLDEGTYGRCAVCGTEIDDERLEARPEVATCREHADALPVGG